MSEIDESDLSVADVLPTGTVTLLLADVEGSTRLWQTVPDEMAAAIVRLDDVLSQIVPGHRGVRPVEQGEGDSFVLAFSRATDAVACALDLQREPLAPIRVRIGVHTGDVQLRDEGNYIGTTINKAARLRDLAHGGQTVLSGAAAELAADSLPPDAWISRTGNAPVARPAARRKGSAAVSSRRWRRVPAAAGGRGCSRWPPSGSLDELHRAAR